MEPQTTKSTNKAGIILGVIVVLIIVSVIAWKISTVKTTTPAPVDNTTSTTTDSNPAPVVENKNKYKDGTYTADGSYRAPSGTEKVQVSLTIKNDVITDATFTGEAKNKVTVEMQSDFNSGFKTEVVGKSIDEISLTVVNGSSLTPKGFMDALAKIKTQAQISA